MKKFISGLIVGLLLAISLTAYAGEIITKINPFPIFVNGEKQDIDAYNINGSTYIKLTDVSNATKGIVNVKFDNENRVINISILDPKLEVENLVSVETTHMTTPDGLSVVSYNNENYVTIGEFHREYFFSRKVNRYQIKELWTLEGNSGNNILINYKTLDFSDFKILLENVPLEVKGDSTIPGYIPYDYYINSILPLIK